MPRIEAQFRAWCLMGLLALPLFASAETREALFKAAAMDDESAVVAMVLRGLNVGAQDEHGKTALLIAATEGSLKVARFLLQQPTVKLDASNAQGESPLMMAALKGQLSMARELIRARANVNKPGWTPLHYASSNPDPESREMVAMLLGHHAYIDAESPNKTTPLMMAARYGHTESIRLLLEEGADPNLRNEQGMTAVDFARSADRDEQADVITLYMQTKSNNLR